MTAAKKPQPAAAVTYPDPGPLPELDWVALDALVVDPRYQRSADSDRSRQVIRRIAGLFDWSKFQPITVTRRDDDSFAVIDGQHRVEAARLHPQVDRVPCLIVAAPEIQDQASSFMAINRDRVGINYLQLHHAAIAAGDAEALRIAEACAEAGVTIPRSPTPQNDLKPGVTMALATIAKGLKVFGAAAVVQALRTLREAHHDKGAQLRGKVVEALIHFFATHAAREIDLDRLRRVLRETGSARLEADGRALRASFCGSQATAIRVRVTRDYNKGLGADKRLPEEA